MKGYGYYGGVFSPLDSLKIPLTDRSYFFGDAVYEVCLGREKKIYQLREHKERLFRSASAVEIPLSEDFYRLEYIASALIEKAAYECFTLYIQLGRVSDTREHSFDSPCSSAMLAAIFASALPQPEDVRLRSEEDKRYDLCGVKTVNLLPAVLSSAAAKKDGYDETVYIRDGLVTECSHSNILIYKDGALISPPPCKAVLPGITRATVLKLGAELGFTVREKFFTEAEMLCADGVFISSTTRLLRRVKEIDGRAVGANSVGIYGHLWDALYKSFRAEI